MSTAAEKWAMLDAAFEALDNHWPFSSLETRQVRYLGDDEKVVDMMIEQYWLGRAPAPDEPSREG